MSELGRGPRELMRKNSPYRHVLAAWGDPEQGTQRNCEVMSLRCTQTTKFVLTFYTATENEYRQ